MDEHAANGEISRMRGGRFSRRLMGVFVGLLVLLAGPLRAQHQHEHHQEWTNPLAEEATPPTPAQKDSAALGLADLEQIALQNNPTLVQAAAQVAGLRSKALQAGLWPNPTVGYIGDQIGVEGTAGEFQGGFIQQEIITAGKRRISRAKYNVQAQVMEFKALEQQLKVLNAVRTHYYNLLAIQQRIELQEAMLANATEHYRTTLEQFNTGQQNRAQVLLAKNQLDRARIDLQIEKNRYFTHWRDLAAVLGTPQMAACPLAGQLEPTCAPLQWEESLQRIWQDSPEILVAQNHVDFTRLSLQREIVEPIPNINLQGSAGYDAESSDTVAGVQVSFRLPIWNRNQGNIRQVEADLARDVANVDRVKLSLQQRLAHKYQQYSNALVTAQTFNQDIIPNAQKAYEIYLEMYKQRRIAWPEVVRLHRNLIELRLEYVHSLLELRRAEVAITGLLLVDGLEAPPTPSPMGHLEVSPQPR